MQFGRIDEMRAAVILSSVVIAHGVSARSLVNLTGRDGSEPTVAELSDQLTPETANALISRLSDDKVRALLRDQLNTHATSGAPAPVTDAAKRLPGLFTKQGEAFASFDNVFGLSGLSSGFRGCFPSLSRSQV